MFKSDFAFRCESETKCIIACGTIEVMLGVVQALQLSPDTQNGLQTYLFLFLHLLIDYLCVKTEEEDEAVIMDQGDSGLSTQSFMPVQQNSEASSAVHQMNQLAYGN